MKINNSNKKFLEYIHIMYGKELDFEHVSEDSNTSKIAQVMFNVPEYDMRKEFDYLKKLCYRYNVELNAHNIEMYMRRGISSENTNLWRSVWFLSNLDKETLTNKYRLSFPEMKSIRVAFQMALESDRDTKILALDRALRSAFRKIFNERRFKVDTDIKSMDPLVVGLNDTDIRYITFSDDEISKKEPIYYVELYKGSLLDRKLHFVEKFIIDPGEDMLTDYKAYGKRINIKNMDVLWVFS